MYKRLILSLILVMSVTSIANAQRTRVRMGGLFSGVRVTAGYGANVNASPTGAQVGWGGGPMMNSPCGMSMSTCGPQMMMQGGCSPCGQQSCGPVCAPMCAPNCVQPQ